MTEPHFVNRPPLTVGAIASPNIALIDGAGPADLTFFDSAKFVNPADQRKWLTKELGLEAGYRLQKFLLKSEHLHYGLFEPDIPVDISNLKAAQDRYLQRLAEVIPAGTKTILDVGCGSGKTAEYLIERGYSVECVSPGKRLTAIASARLDEQARIHCGRFEDLSFPNRYDLVLFSESFQYIPMATALAKSISILNPAGHILICDFFKTARDGESPIRGGHGLAQWCETYPLYPLDIVFERDITAETAPLHDLSLAFSQEVLKPLWDGALIAAAARWPLMTRFGRLVFRKEISKIEKYRLSDKRNGDAFRYFKIYKTYLFRVKADFGGPAHSVERFDNRRQPREQAVELAAPRLAQPR
jgi:SAM-dependent methyltransferase